MPKINKLHDVSAETMRATSTPILAVIARMAVNELEARAGVAAETLAAMARGRITDVERLCLAPHAKGRKRA